MALIVNLRIEKSEINQTWILTDYAPKGWHFSSEKIDVLKFNENSTLEMISIEDGVIRSINYEINKDNEIILKSGVNFGRIISVNKNQLVIQHGKENSSIEKTYSPLPKSEFEFSKSEIIQQIKSQNWSTELEKPNNKGKMILTLGKSEKENDFEMQLAMKFEKGKIIMPFELKRVEKCWFLSCQIPDIFGGSASLNLGKENYMINKITKDEIIISFGLDKEFGIQSFTKEE